MMGEWPLLVILSVLAMACGPTQVQGHSGRPSFFRRRNPDGTFNQDYPSQDPLLYSRNLGLNTNINISPMGPLPGDTAEITVTWSGIEYPSAKDWLAIYSPSDSSDYDFVDYQHNFHAASSGQMKFNVTNMRSDFEFRYLKNYTVLATSHTVSWVPNTPMRVKIALTNDPTQMQVSWNSDSRASPIVRWGTRSSAPFEHSTIGNHTTTYYASDMCNAPANVTSAQLFRDPGFFHTVLLKDLNPSTRYYYTVGSSGSDITSKIYSFVSPPSPGVPQHLGDMRFIMLADHGVTGCFREYGACGEAPRTVQMVSNQIQHNETNLILHVGDIAYAVGFGYLWEMYGVEIEPMAATAPYMVSVGNHEYDHTGYTGTDPSGASGNGYHPSWGNMGDDSNGECGVPISHRFHGPGGSVFWYSFDYGPVHIIMLSAEHDLTPGSVQHEWLAQDLATVDRSVTPWVIANSHRPLYSSEDYQGEWVVCEHLQEAIEPLLYKYSVDLFLTGHYHSYERTCPVYNQECCPPDESCPVHIVAGMAGISLDNGGYFSAEWSVVRNEEEYGFMRLTVHSDHDYPYQGSLDIEFVSNKDGSVVDTTTLTKNQKL